MRKNTVLSLFGTFFQLENPANGSVGLSPSEKTPPTVRWDFLHARRPRQQPNGTFSVRENAANGSVGLSPSEKTQNNSNYNAKL
jgi:hypothetical protein